MESTRVGAGAANERDRPELAMQMLTEGDVEYLGFDNLAERTLAFAHLRKGEDPRAGENPLVRERMGPMLAPAREKGVRMAGNFGAANPERAAEILHEEAIARGIERFRVGLVLGDDVTELVQSGELPLQFWETGGGVDSLPGPVISANVYLGAEPILRALQKDADVVVTGRAADFSPYIAMLAHHFGWSLDDWPRIAGAAAVGHMLECGRYVTGGAHADPFYGKETPDIENLALPLAEAFEDGHAIISKPPNSGGMISVATCTEQILHEVHDVSRYLSPDLVLDVRELTFEQVGPDQVEMKGAKGSPPTDTYKAVCGVQAGWIAEGEITFPGPGCVRKAEITAEMVKSRLRRAGAELEELRVDLIGLNSIFGPMSVPPAEEPPEVRLRIAGRSRDKGAAAQLEIECEDMWFGPIGGGGVRTVLRPVLAMYSTLIPRDKVPITVRVTEREDMEMTL
jgi:hypothetical protein